MAMLTAKVAVVGYPSSYPKTMAPGGGSLLVADSSRLTYLVQAVDRRGNLSWLDYEVIDEEDLPTSGVPLNLPDPVDVDIALGTCRFGPHGKRRARSRGDRESFDLFHRRP